MTDESSTLGSSSPSSLDRESSKTSSATLIVTVLASTERTSTSPERHGDTSAPVTVQRSPRASPSLASTAPSLGTTQPNEHSMETTLSQSLESTTSKGTTDEQQTTTSTERTQSPTITKSTCTAAGKYHYSFSMLPSLLTGIIDAIIYRR